MTSIPGNTPVQKTAVTIVVTSYVLMVIAVGVISISDFQDAHLLATGSKVEGEIITISPSKGGSSGWVKYRLPNGLECHDWTMIAPNGVAHAGEALTLAVRNACGHPVSAKKRLAPWLYLGMLIFLLIPAFQVLKSRGFAIRDI